MTNDVTGSTRKVISLGKASFAIILPKDWVKEQKIEKGSEVLLFPQKNGQIIVQKSRMPRTKVVLDAADFSDELLDAAIQSSYILNIDETIVRFPPPENLDDKMNHLAELSKKFAGMNLAISGTNEVTISNLVNMMKLRVNEIFDQLLAILWLLLEQIEREDYDRDNSSQMAQMEGKYRLGVRLLIFALRNQHLEFEAGMSDIIQVLGSRIALRALRSLILQVNNIIPYLKTAEIPNLPVVLKYFKKLTQQAVKCLYETEIYSIKQINDYWNELEPLTDKIEDQTGIIRNFFMTYYDIIGTFKEVSVTRHIEGLESLIEEEPAASE